MLLQQYMALGKNLSDDGGLGLLILIRKSFFPFKRYS